MTALVAFVFAALLSAPGGTVLGRAAPELLVEKWALPGEATPPRLSALKGKVVAMLFFQATCRSCHNVGFPLMQEIEKQLGANPDLTTLYLQTTFEAHGENTFDAGRATVAKYGLKGPFAQDRRMPGSIVPATFQRFRAGMSPWIVIVDREGVVRYSGYPDYRNKTLALLRDLLGVPQPAASPSPAR